MERRERAGNYFHFNLPVYKRPSLNQSAQVILYYPSLLLPKTAVTLVVHGLNVKPTAMEPLINWLAGQGSDVYLVPLSGHHEKGASIKDVTASLWEAEMLAGYQQARTAATDNKLPLYFLGYSLGALLGQSMIALKQQGVCFDKQVLLAPATAIRTRSYLLKCLFIFGKQRMLPSFTPQSYRANAALPLAIYQILFREVKKVVQAGLGKWNVPTLILIDPKDELISYRKLVRYVNRYNLTNCQILTLNKELKGRKDHYRHLILDEETMGAANWVLVTMAMKQFLFTASA